MPLDTSTPPWGSDPHIDEHEWELVDGLGSGRHSTRHYSGRSVAQRSLLSTPLDLQLQSPLFALPAELRLNIYELLLFVPSGLRITNRTNRESPSILSLLQTCRRILAEAEDIFYSIQRLQFSLSECTPFLNSIGTKRREAITSISIAASNGSQALAQIQDLYLAPNLRSLYIMNPVGLRYLNISSWTLLARQLEVEMHRLDRLEELKVVQLVLHEADTEGEKERRSKFDAFVARLQDAVSGRGRPAESD